MIVDGWENLENGVESASLVRRVRREIGYVSMGRYPHCRISGNNSWVSTSSSRHLEGSNLLHRGICGWITQRHRFCCVSAIRSSAFSHGGAACPNLPRAFSGSRFKPFSAINWMIPCSSRMLFLWWYYSSTINSTFLSAH